MRPRSTMIACTTVTAIAISATAGLAGDQREIVIGVLCDRTGPTQIIGVNMCPAYHDYMNLVNQRGGVEGYKIKADEIDVEYKVCLLYTSPSPRDRTRSRMPSSA